MAQSNATLCWLKVMTKKIKESVEKMMTQRDVTRLCHNLVTHNNDTNWWHTLITQRDETNEGHKVITQINNTKWWHQ